MKWRNNRGEEQSIASDSSATLSSAPPLRTAEDDFLTLSPLRVGKQQTNSSVAAWSSCKIVTSRSGWFVCLFDGKQTPSPLLCISTWPRSVTTSLTQNVQCHDHNTPWRLLGHESLTPFLKSSGLFTALLQHRRNETREGTNSPSGLHHLPLLKKKKRQEQDTTMCLQSCLPPCETLFRWFWCSAG